MTSDWTKVRALMIYAIIAPIALVIGYYLATPGEFTSWALVGLFLLTLFAPLVLKWHRPLLFLSWNMTAVVFFLPGRPKLWLVAAIGSLILSVVERTLVRERRFISAPSITLPLILIALVVYATAKATHGFGMRTFGSSSIGGSRYILIFGGLLGCFAMMTERIPPQKAMFYVGLFFLGSLANALSDTFVFVSPAFYYLYYVFPPDIVGGLSGSGSPGLIRFFGSSIALMGVFFYLLARFGVRNILGRGQLHRALFLLAISFLASLSGFRSMFILMVLTFLLVFYWEGLLRSRYAAVLAGCTVLAAVLVIPFASKLPLSLQRTLSLLPIKVDPVARLDAQHSTEWRVQMWERLWPEVPEYFWLGKGLLMDAQDLNMTMYGEQRGLDPQYATASTASDYHNGPLTTIIPFGIWGVLGWIWFLTASVRACYLNYRYGEESLKRINTFLLAYLLARILLFLFIFGSFYSDVQIFAGIVGLDVALNGGICKPSRAHTIVEPVTLSVPARFKPAHAVPGLPRSGISQPG